MVHFLGCDIDDLNACRLAQHLIRAAVTGAHGLMIEQRAVCRESGCRAVRSVLLCRIHIVLTLTDEGIVQRTQLLLCGHGL